MEDPGLTDANDDQTSDAQQLSGPSVFSSTFGSISGRLQHAVQMVTSTSSSSSVSSSSSGNPVDVVSNGAILNEPSMLPRGKSVDSEDPIEPSETESITTETSAGMVPCDGTSDQADEAEEVSILEAKIQILFGQLHTRDATIEQLRTAHNNTRQDFEIFEKESAECMEELGCDIQDLREKLQDKEDRILELESLQIIPEHLEGQEELIAELEKMSQNLRKKDERIRELEEIAEEDSLDLANEESLVAELRSELETMRQKMKEKDEMLEKVEDSELMNFSLVEDRDDEIERLNAKIAELEGRPTIKASRSGDSNDESVGAEDANADGSSNQKTHRSELEAKIQQLQDDLDERDSELDALRETGMQHQEELETMIEELTQQLADRAERVEQLETANRLNEELIGEIEKLDIQNENENIEELRDTLIESDARCNELQSNVDTLSRQLDIAVEQIDEHEKQAAEVNDVLTRLEAETERCGKLDAKVHELNKVISDRNKKMLHLGFNSEVELIEAFQDVQKDLQRSDNELSKLRLRQNQPGMESGRAIPANTDDAERSGRLDTKAAADDPKSVEALLIEEGNLRKRVKSKVKSLTSYLQNRDFDDDARPSTDDLHELYFHLARQIREIVGELSARDGVGNDLIKAFQLKLEYTASVESALSAREAQIQMLTQELEELEQNKDNLNTSINSTCSNNSLLVSSKLEELLIDLHERDEKLKVLEWLTVDLSKTLEAQSEELDEVRESAAGEKRRSEKKIDEMLADAKNRETELASLKRLLEAEEAAVNEHASIGAKLSQEVSHREGLQAMVDSLTVDLQESERTIAALEAEIESKAKDSSRKEGLYEARILQEVSKREGLQSIVDSLANDAKEAEKKIASLEFEVKEVTKDVAEKDAKISQELAQRESLQATVQNSRTKLQQAQKTIAQLEAEVESREQKLSQEVSQREGLQAMVDSLTTDLQASEEKMASLDFEVKKSVTDVEQRDARLSQETTQRAGLQAMVDTLTLEAKQAQQTIGDLEAKLKLSADDADHREGLQTMIDSLVADLQDAETKASRLETAVESKQQELLLQNQEHQQAVASLENELNAADSSMKVLEVELEAKNNFIRMREAQLDKLAGTESSLQATMQRMDELESELRGAREQLRERFHQVVTLVYVSDMANRNILALEQETRSRDHVLEDFEQDIDALVSDLKNRDQRIEELIVEKEAALDIAQAKEDELDVIPYLENQVEELRDKNRGLLCDLNSQAALVEDLRLDLETRRAESVQHSAAAAQLRLENARMMEEKALDRQESTKACDAHVKERLTFETKIDDLKAKNKALVAELKSREDQLDEASELVGQMDELKALNANLLSDLESWEVRVNELERVVAAKDEVFQEMTVIEQLLEDQKARTQDLVNEIDSLTTSLEAKEREIEGLKADNSAKETEVGTTKAALEQKERELQCLQTERSRHETLIANLEQECRDYAELKVSHQEIQDESKGLKSEVDALKQQCQEHDELTQRHKATQRELAKEVESLLKKCRKYAELESRLDSSQQACERLENESSILREKCQDHEKLMLECEGQQQEYCRLKEEMDTLVQTLDSLRNKEMELGSLKVTHAEQREEIGDLQEQCQAHQATINNLEQKCQELALMEEECLEKAELCTMLQNQLESLGKDRNHDIQTLQISLQKREEELGSLKEANVQYETTIKELQEQCEEYLKKEQDYQEKTEHCIMIECQLKELGSIKDANEENQATIKELQELCEEHAEKEKDFDQTRDHCEKLESEIESLKAENDHKIQSLQSTLFERDETLGSLRAENDQHRATIEDLQQQCLEFASIKKEHAEKEEMCERLERQVESLAESLRTTKEQMEQQAGTMQSPSLKETTLREEVEMLQDEVDELHFQLDKLTHEKAVLVDSIAAMQERTTLAEEDQLQQQQKLFSQLSNNMESVAQALDEREKQLEAREEDGRLKDAFVAELQKKIDRQSKDMESLIDEHESECSEMRSQLDSMSAALRDAQQHAGHDVRSLEEALRQEKARCRTMKAENDKVQEQLSAIGFGNMDELVRGLASKCQEHTEMEQAIVELDAELTSLRRDLDREKAKGASGLMRHDPRTNNNCHLHVHKIRELEMKIDIFRDEITGKNAIIKDLTLRLNGESTDDPDYSSTDRFSQNSKDAPGLRIKRVPGAVNGGIGNNNNKPEQQKKNVPDTTSDESAAKTAKALATIPQLISALKERDGALKERDLTIENLQKEIATSKRAIEGLAKGLEYNVQEKIEADKLVHEKQTEVSMFASKVQQLSKQLKQKEKLMEKLEKDSKRVMKRNLASYDEIKALSVNELVDLLRQSRVLSEDLEQERERLIANATNMSIALAESRNRVDELMRQLGPEMGSLSSDNDEPGRIHTRAKPTEVAPPSEGVRTPSPLSPTFWGRPTRKKKNLYSPL